MYYTPRELKFVYHFVTNKLQVLLLNPFKLQIF